MNGAFDFSRIREIENMWIELTDGTRLAARIWLPADAADNAVPAILEYIPYRKRDLMRTRDESLHRYFAANGYAAVRVDVRGSGDSEGVLTDEYSHAEIEDAAEIIAWIRRQDWCAGSVGMMGISWGGFNSLQVAATRPEGLKAIITLCASDDRYTDDAHYMGGCLLSENLQWGSILMAYGAYPPDPEIVGDKWREVWRQRIENLNPFPAVWMTHPHRDDYWKHGSVCEDFSAIDVPVYAVGGWADAYRNAVFRLLAGLDVPRKGLIGPWAHIFPQNGYPEPAIGFLQEAVRWWDHWLKGRDTGVMDGPMLRAWMQEWVPPAPQYAERPGRWIAEDDWPSPRIGRREFFLCPGRLEGGKGAPVSQSIASPQTTGSRAGEWCAFGADGEMPLDQRADDGRSLTYETEPLSEALEIFGFPSVALEISLDAPQGLISVRLNDIAPDGRTTQVTYGMLNLSHRGGHDTPRPMIPGVPEVVRVELNAIAHRFPTGHRIGLAVSTAYWPLVWPAPTSFVATIHCGESCLGLPVRPPRPEDENLPPFEEPVSAPATDNIKLRRQPLRRTLEVDLTTGENVYTLHGDGGEIDGAALARIQAIDLDVGYTLLKRFRIGEQDPLSAQGELQQRMIMRRGEWSVRIECRTRLTSTADAFQFTGDVETFEGDDVFLRREWNLTIPRRYL